jgi:hypothetical protein
VSGQRIPAGRIAGWWLAAVVLALSPVGAQDATVTADAGPVRVVASAEPREVTIGDRIRYVVEVTSDAEAEVRIPVLAGNVGDFTIVDFGEIEPRRDGTQTTIGRWYTLTIFDTGDFLVPAPQVEYRIPGEPLLTATGNEVLVGVASVLAGDPEAKDIRDIKPPEEVPFDWTPYLILGGIVTGSLLLVALLYHLLNRPRRERGVAPRPAHEVALAALEDLQRQRLVDAGRIDEFYVGLTRIIRTYLEDGFHVRAPEMTTEEFLGAAGADARLSPPQRRLLGEFLSQADLVKFARFVPTPRDCSAAYEAARRFVDETRPRSAEEQGEANRATA